MVRPADSRLLSNLLHHEKEYTKQFITLVDTSNASLTSLAAYAAASPQPLSQVIMAVAGSLAAADDALRRYAQSVETWRDTMARLKDMEDEVGNVIRDKEILVTRIIKATKSSKQGSSIIGASTRSSSSLSLSNTHDSSSSRHLSLTFSTSSKLGAAQSELQACELHLATKERELALKRSSSLREGLGARLKALVDCGWAWGELGKEGLRSLEALQHDSHAGDGALNPRATDADSFFVKASSDSGISSISPSQSASQINHDLRDMPPPIFQSFHSTELLSAPPLTAEPSANTIRPVSMATTNTTSGTHSGSGTSTPAQAALLAATSSTLTYAPAVAVHIPPSSTPSAVGIAGEDEAAGMLSVSAVHLLIPPPHALGSQYMNIPLAEVMNNNVSSDSLDNSGRGDPEIEEHTVAEKTETLETSPEGRKANKNIGERPVRETNATRQEEPDSDSSSDEAHNLRKLEVVENSRFMSEKPKGVEEKNGEPLRSKDKEQSFDPQQSTQAQGGHWGVHISKNPKASSPSSSKTFFGSLKGFFSSKDKSSPHVRSPSSKSRAEMAESSDSSSSASDNDSLQLLPASKKKRRVLKTLLFRTPDKKTTGAGAKSDLGKGSFDSWNYNPGISGQSSGGGKQTTGSSRALEKTAGTVIGGSVDRLELGTTPKRNSIRRTRAASDVGTSVAPGLQSNSLEGQPSRRLKKNRTANRVERNGSSGSELDVRVDADKPTRGFGGPPVAVSAKIAKAAWLEGHSTDSKSPSYQNGEIPLTAGSSTSKRSNSVDHGNASRRKKRRASYILVDHPDNGASHKRDEEGSTTPTPSSSKVQIIDLGERRAKDERRVRGDDGHESDNVAQRKATAVTVHSDEDPPDHTERRLSRDKSLRSGAANDTAKPKRTGGLGRSSFSASPRTPTSPRYASSSTAIPKSHSGTSPTDQKSATTLMDIVENVKRIREDGQMMSKSERTVVRAPPRTTREELEHSTDYRMLGRAGGEPTEDTIAGSVLFQVHAPGSILDHKHMSSKSSSATASPNTSVVGSQQRQGHGRSIMPPLKSALKNSSRTPSPSPLAVSPPLPLVSVGSPLAVSGNGVAKTEGTYDSDDEQFFTDEGDEPNDSRGIKQPVHQVLPTSQSPRKRKSVRVSLKPTFSPAPPAIEDEGEEGASATRSSADHYFWMNHAPKLQTVSSHAVGGEGNQQDKWEDSSDEDEEYRNAKAALSRAAKKR